MVSRVKQVEFSLNNESITLCNVDPCLSLNQWIREHVGLTGTKIMCSEGGCGCCVIYCEWSDPFLGQKVKASVNSCLCPLYSVNGWSITTVEGIGNSTVGYHNIQKTVAERNSSQCGYCTPGFVMSMYSLLQQKRCVTEKEIENQFDGNLCRCTGYRPILDSMKTFANQDQDCIPDIEDVSTKRPCYLSCLEGCGKSEHQSGLHWYRPLSLQQVFDLLGVNKERRVKLICGGTGKGVFKYDSDPDVVIDLKGITDLWKREVEDKCVIIGACVSFSLLIDFLCDHKEKSVSFEELALHLQQIANVAIRNCGTWAGNLMLKHTHPDFASDVVTIMEAAGAKVTIATMKADAVEILSLADFLSVPMDDKLIVSLKIPFLPKEEKFKSMKVMPRAQNAHAYVNAGFRILCDPSTSTIEGTPSLVFGGISDKLIHAKETEQFLVGKVLKNEATLTGALSILEKELTPSVHPCSSSADYRKSLACSMLYKLYLGFVGDGISPEMSTAAISYQRPVSSGLQSFDEPNPDLQPVTQSIPNLSALLLASGEAVFTTDLPHTAKELQGAFVLTSVGNATIVSVDAQEAVSMPGVVAFVSAKDIPEKGVNNFLSKSSFSYPEQIFATNESLYAGQALGIIVADTRMHAANAACKVKVDYRSLGPPVLSIKDAIERDSFFADPDPLMMGDEDVIRQAKHTVSGEVSCGTQYHFTMETQTSLVVPEEDGYTVHASTQWMQMAQSAVSMALGVPASSVNVHVKRIGGGYGAKISRSHMVTAACALGAYVTKRPVRIHMDLDSNMKMVGKRYPYLVKYLAGFDDDGAICGIKMNIFNDSGCYNNDQEYGGGFLYQFMDAAYSIPNWILIGKSCKTNLPANTWCRAPASVQGTFITESVMEHIARYLGGTGYEEVRLRNMYSEGDLTPMFYPLEGCNLKDLWKDIHASSDLEARKKAVEDFNKSNRWRKRGLAVIPSKFPIDWSNCPFSVLVSVFVEDGTVAIAHAGVEMGQGVNTKVAQAAARHLGIPLSFIKIQPSNTLTGANSGMDGSSVSTELNVKAVVAACETLTQRMAPVREKMAAAKPDEAVAWAELVQKCHSKRVDLSARGYVNESGEMLYQYLTYGVSCAEVEVDVLTGKVEVLRADVLYDCGQSMNPKLDIGQIEGAFVMGIGYWLTEEVKYDRTTGELLTHNTWEYKPPSSKDIPVDFNVSLVKNRPNPSGVLGAKAVGEPPQCMSCAVLFAVKRAVFSARKDAGIEDYFTLDAPATLEVIQQACQVNTHQFKL